MRRTPWILLLLAASCGGPKPDVQSKDPYERYLGVKELAGTRDFARIVPFLQDRHYLPVLGALEVLASTGEPHAFQHVAPLLKHEHPLVRRQACATAGALGGEEGIPFLAAALQDPDPAVRREAAKALGKFGRKDGAISALLQALGDKDPSVAYMAHLKLSEVTGLEVAERSRDAWDRALKAP